MNRLDTALTVLFAVPAIIAFVWLLDDVPS